ncbi:OmpP1/FadL family transporter [Brucella sp. IR073]|uniref:OmpP1/FadL family transporter n=1 Tax=unclassified Brucella TaxID=2632610 RepID=UPI003B9823EF
MTTKIRGKAPFALAMLAGALALGIDAASAGGFSRGEADTDILFMEGNYGFRSSAIYVAPRRTYATLNGRDASDGAYSDSFWVPSVALKAKLGASPVTCALTYTQPFGTDATYGEGAQNAEAETAMGQGLPLINPTTKLSFSTDEYGATCAVRFDAGRGGLHLIGGVFYETFEYDEDTWFGSIHLEDDGGFGYRLGAAYDIPEYAMRFQVLYRSQVKHDAEGIFTASELAGGYGIIGQFPSVGGGILPQSVKLSAQSGIAPGWLVYGSVTWTDWSVLPHFRYDVEGLIENIKIFNYKDGYTIQLGVGHEFTKQLSGTVNLTWDQGVGSGADITTDTWTVGLGGEYKGEFGTLGLGVSVSYLTSGSQSETKGATFNATADGDWATGVGVSYSYAF